MNPGSAVLPAVPRGLRALAWVLAVHGVAFAVSEMLVPYTARPAWLRVYSAGGFLPLQLGSAFALWTAARRTDLPRATQEGLRSIAAAFLAISAGSAVWLVMGSLGRPLPYISWADAIFFLFYPFLIAGVLRLPTAPARTDRVANLLGWAVVILAFGSLIAFAARVEATRGELSVPARFLVTATSFGQLATLLVLNRGVERARRLPSPGAVTLLLSALALSAMGDLVFQILFSTMYSGRNWNVPIAVLVNLLVLQAAFRFLTAPMPLSDAQEATRTAFSPLPIVAVSAVALMLVWMSTTGQATNLGALMAGLVALNAVLVVRDVVTSRAAAAAMQQGVQREAARRLDALVRNASDAILLLDPECRLAFASAPADRLFGRPVSAMEGVAFSSLLPADEVAAWDAFVDGLEAQPGQPATHVWRLTRADGSSRLIESVGIDLRREPAVGGVVLNSRDVTERISLEERLRQAQKLEVAGRLAGGVAHDFNNVLTTVMASTELAQFALPEDHPAQVDLAGIAGAAQRGAALTRRLLAFVRQEPVPAQSVDVAAMLHELEPLLVRLAGEAAPVTLRASGGLGEVRVDRTELEHLVFNLVANARDAMPAGGPITVTAEPLDLAGAVDDPAFVIAPAPGRYIAIAVADAGVGMTDEVRLRMFDPFYTQKSGGRGTGLGLIGARPLIEGTHGGLRVDSTPGRGTRVTLLLPRITEAAESRTSGEQRVPLPITRAPRTRRTLLVEDEVDVREQLTRLLESMGHEVTAAATARDARDRLVTPGARFDLVISDVMMPGESGPEFAAWLRRTHRAVRILLISGHTGTALDRVSRETGDLPLLRKPFGSAELAERIESLFAGEAPGQAPGEAPGDAAGA